jgi:RNA polymerase sigma-70 factor (ECF subfamily)
VLAAPRSAPARSVADSLAADLNLVRRVRLGDDIAFEQIFRDYYARLVSFARTNLGCQDLAEETVQEVFLHIWARRDIWVIERSLAAYLFRAVRNRISNARRSLKLETSYGTEIARDAEDNPAAPSDERLREAEIEAALARALELLPERPRQVFLLSRRQQLSYGEISEVLGIGVKTVEMHMGRALAQLRLSLAEWRRP